MYGCMFEVFLDMRCNAMRGERQERGERRVKRAEEEQETRWKTCKGK